MQPEHINRVSESTRVSYRLFGMALTGAFGRALDQGDPTSSRARTEFKAAVTGLGRDFVDLTTQEVRSGLDEVAKTAVMMTGLAPSEGTMACVREHVAWLKDIVCDRIRECVSRDCATAEQAFRRLALNVEIASMRGSMGRTTAVIGARYGAVRNLSFVQQDRLGRKLSSDAFVRTLVRDALLNAYVETFLFVQASAGFDIAKATKGDGESVTFSITGNTKGMPSYDEIRDGLFHPQSSASLEIVKD